MDKQGESGKNIGKRGKTGRCESGKDTEKQEKTGPIRGKLRKRQESYGNRKTWKNRENQEKT